MKRNLLAAATATLLIAGLAGCASTGTSAVTTPAASGSTVQAAPVAAAPGPLGQINGQNIQGPVAINQPGGVAAPLSNMNNQAPAPAAPTMTAGQSNALGSAKHYLSFTAFSRNGLIRQLSSSAGDGYSVADATYAVDHVGADWSTEAAQAAKRYLSIMSFSRAGLIRQLDSSAGDGYTLAQATYGVTAAGL